VPLAEGSDKTAVENQQDMRLAAKIGETYRFAIEIEESEFRRWGI
jgi:hypothetical protein